MSSKPFIVAEMSANHLRSFDRAIEIIEAAAWAGADAVKLQTFTPEQMVGDPNYIIPDGPWHGRRLLSLYEEAHTPREWHAQIFGRCKELGIECFSTPFHRDDVDFLESLNCPRYKIASFEITDLELIEACARTGKQVIISTGMASAAEISKAVAVARRCGASDVVLLKCTSAYPAKPSDANLATMKYMRYLAEVGISDHTPGIAVAVVATTLGATVIEKHLTLSREDGGPDAEFSMEPREFAQMVTECRRAASAIGNVQYGPGISESSNFELRRSLWVTKAIRAGEVLTEQHIHTARPALGLSPSRISSVIGRAMKKDAIAGTPLTEDLFE